MIYYVILWFVRRFMEKRLWLVFTLFSTIVVIWYLLLDRQADWGMYGATYFKWGHYFLFMLLGAMVGRMSKQNWKFSLKKDLGKLFICLVAFYAILIGASRNSIICQWQIVSLLPL